VNSADFAKGQRRAENRFRHHSSPPTTTVASLAVLDSLIQEVSLTVSIFLAQRRSNQDRLTKETSRKIRALVATRPYQTNKEVRTCLAFWASLNNVYGSDGERSSDLITSLLDTWQDWINCSPDLAESALLDATLWWLEEFDQSDVGWRPARMEANFFAAVRIREAAHQYLRMHQGLLPEIRKVSEIRPAREHRTMVLTPDKPTPTVTSQPMHIPGVGAYFGSNCVSISGLKGNIEDYWPFPK
jgi:hypothetical protein